MSQKIDIMWLKQRTLGYWGFTLHPKDKDFEKVSKCFQKDKDCRQNFRFEQMTTFTKGLSESSLPSRLECHDLVLCRANIVVVGTGSWSTKRPSWWHRQQRKGLYVGGRPLYRKWRRRLQCPSLTKTPRGLTKKLTRAAVEWDG